MKYRPEAALPECCLISYCDPTNQVKNELTPRFGVCMASTRRLIVALVFLFPVFAAQADSWKAAAVQARASANGQFVVRVVPGTSKGDVFGYAGEQKGPYATAEWHKFNGTSYVKVAKASLLNPVAPVDIEVTNDGLLVALDNWHNLGVGAVVVIYKPSGTIAKKYALQDLYSKSDVARIQTSTSSIRWRCSGLSTSLESRNKLSIDDSLGGRFVFDLDSGAFEYDRKGGSCK